MKGTSYQKGEPTNDVENSLYLKTHGLIAVIATERAAHTFKDHGLDWEMMSWRRTPDENTWVAFWKVDPEVLHTAFATSFMRVWTQTHRREEEEGWTLQFGIRWLAGDATVYLKEKEDVDAVLRQSHPMDAPLKQNVLTTLSPTRVLMDSEVVNGRRIPTWDSEKQEGILEKRKQAPHHWIAVAYDVHEGCAFKRYKLVRASDLTDFIAGTHTPFYYEIIPKDTPVRLVVDAEMPWTGIPTWSERRDFKEGLLRCINKALATLTGYTGKDAGGPRWVVKNNSREGKMSLHLLLQDVYFEDHTDGPKAILLEAKKELWADAEKRETGLTYLREDKRTQTRVRETALDTSIYTKNRVIRFLGCAKRKEERGDVHALCARVETESPTDPECKKGDPRWRDAFQSMRVTLPDLDLTCPQTWTCLKVPPQWDRGVKKETRAQRREKDASGVRQDTPPTGPHRPPTASIETPPSDYHPTLLRVMECIRRENPSAHLTRHERGETYWTVFLSNARNCQIRQGTHKSNNIYVSLDMASGVLRQLCHDEDCAEKLIKGHRIPILGHIPEPTMQPEGHLPDHERSLLKHLIQTWSNVHRDAWEGEEVMIQRDLQKQVVLKTTRARLILDEQGGASLDGEADVNLDTKERFQLHHALFKDSPHWLWTRLRQGNSDQWMTLTPTSMESVLNGLLAAKKVNSRRKKILQGWQDGEHNDLQKVIGIIVDERHLLFEEGVPKVTLTVGNSHPAAGSKRKRDMDTLDEHTRKNIKGIESCWNAAREQGHIQVPPAEHMKTEARGMTVETGMATFAGFLQERTSSGNGYWFSTHTSSDEEALMMFTPMGGKTRTFGMKRQDIDQALRRAGVVLDGHEKVVIVNNTYYDCVQNNDIQYNRSDNDIAGKIIIDAETASEVFLHLKEWHLRKGYPVEEKAYWRLISAIKDEKAHIMLSNYIANRLLHDMRYATNPFETNEGGHVYTLRHGRYKRAKKQIDYFVQHKMLTEWFGEMAECFQLMKDKGLCGKLGTKEVDVYTLFNSLWDVATKTNLAKINAAVSAYMQNDEFYEEKGMLTGELFYLQLNRRIDVFAFKNGIYDLDKQCFVPNGPDCIPYYTTYLADFDYHEGHRTEEEEALRNEIETQLYQKLFPDERMRRRAKEMVGSLLLGGNQGKVLWWMLGGRNTGKTSFIHAISAVFQDYATTTDISILMKDVGCVEKPREDLLDIIHRKVVFCSENNKGQRLNVKNIKTFQGGDDVPMRGLYGKLQKVSCMATFVIATNDIPAMESEEDIDNLHINFIDFNVDMNTCQQKVSKNEWSKNVQRWAPVHFKMMLEWYDEWAQKGMTFTEVETEAKKKVAEDSAVAHFVEEIQNKYFTTDCLIESGKHIHVTLQKLLRDSVEGAKLELESAANALKKAGVVCGGKQVRLADKKVRYPVYVIEKKNDLHKEISPEEYLLFCKKNSMQ